MWRRSKAAPGRAPVFRHVGGKVAGGATLQCGCECPRTRLGLQQKPESWNMTVLQSQTKEREKISDVNHPTSMSQPCSSLLYVLLAPNCPRPKVCFVEAATEGVGCSSCPMLGSNTWRLPVRAVPRALSHDPTATFCTMSCKPWSKLLL